MCLLLIVVHWARPGYVIAQTDLFPLFDPINYFQKTFWAWNTSISPFGNYGIPSFSLYYLATAALSRVLGATYGQLALQWLLISSAWLGAFCCARAYRMPALASITVAWIYCFTPYTQLYVVTFMTAMVFAASLPWLIYVIVEARRDSGRRPFLRAVTVTIAIVLLPMIAATPQLYFSLILVVLAFALFPVAPGYGLYLRWIASTMAFALIASLWWLLPAFAALLLNTITHPTTPSLVSWTFARASLLNDLRLLPLWTWAYADYSPYAHRYDANVLVLAADYLLAIGLALGVIVCRGERLAAVRKMGIIALTCIFLVKGLHPPLEAVNALIYKLPGFFLLIEPAGLVIAASFFLALATGLALSSLEAAPARRLLYRIACVAAGMLALISAYPVIDGEVFHDFAVNQPSMYVAAPPSWTSLARKLNTSPKPGSVLVLPADDFYQREYTWGYNGADVIPAMLIHRSVLIPGSGLTYFIDARVLPLTRTIDELLRERSPDTPAFLRSLGIRFVIARGDLKPRDETYLSQVDAMRTFARAQAQHFGNLTLYDLGALPAAPSQSDRVITGSYGGLTMADFTLLKAFVENEPRIGAQALSPRSPIVPQEGPHGAQRLVAKAPKALATTVPAGKIKFLLFRESSRLPEVPLITHPYSASPARALLQAAAAQVTLSDLAITIMNPSAQLVRARIAARMPHGAGSDYLITCPHALVLARANDTSGRAVFGPVTFRPGNTECRMHATRIRARPLRGLAGSDVEILGATYVGSAVTYFRNLATAPLVMGFDDAPILSLRTRVPLHGRIRVGVRVIASIADRYVACGTDLTPGASAALNDLFEACLWNNGLLTRVDIHDIRYRSVDEIAWNDRGTKPVGAIRPPRLTISTLATKSATLRAPGSLVPVTPGLTLATLNARSGGTIFGGRISGLDLASIGTAGCRCDTTLKDGKLVTNGQMYNPYWLAVALPGGVLPHVVVDGWDNGWLAPRGSRVIVSNLFNDIEAAGFAIMVVTLGIVWWRR